MIKGDVKDKNIKDSIIDLQILFTKIKNKKLLNHFVG